MNRPRVALYGVWAAALLTLAAAPTSAQGVLAPPGAKAGPAAPEVGKPGGMQVVPGKPLDLKWTKVKPQPAPRPLRLGAGRVVGGAADTLVSLSPDGDAAALRDKAGRTRVLQLLSGRVSPHLPIPEGADVRLAVSGFATVAWSKAGFTRWHTWTGGERGAVARKGLSKGPVRALAVDPGARFGAVITEAEARGTPKKGDAAEEDWRLCATLVPLRGDARPRTACWGGSLDGDAHNILATTARFTDDGAALWVAATTNWEASCGGGGEATEVVRIPVATDGALSRWRSERDPVEGGQAPGDLMVDHAVSLPGQDGVQLSQADAPRAPKLRLRWHEGAITAQVLTEPGAARPVRGGRTWLRVHDGAVVVHAPGGGFIEDAAALPRSGRVTLADDGHHLAVQTPEGLLLWQVRSGRAVAWLPGATAPTLARSRALWRDAKGALRTATWEQLQALRPGVASLGVAADGRVGLVLRALGAG